jgi:Tol biopolymer transport system component
MRSDQAEAASATESAGTGPVRSRAGRLGMTRGLRLGGHARAGPAVALTAAAGLAVAGATTVVDAATTSSSTSRASIVFEREVSSGSQLFTRNRSGTRQHQLTFGPQSAEMPRWAPYGHRILYLRRPPNDAHLPDLMVMGARGRHKQQLLAGGTTHFISDMAWSPSGRRIVLVRTLRNGFSDLFIYTLATGTLARMGVNSEPRRDPSTVDWAPDGRIFFSAVDYTEEGDGFEDHDLFAVRPDASGLTQLTDTPLRDELLPRVSPDGQKLAYAQRSSVCASVRIADTDAASTVRLHTDCNAFRASWSPTGNRVLLQKFNRQGEFVIWIMAPDGTHRRFVTVGENADWRPVTH